MDVKCTNARAYYPATSLHLPEDLNAPHTRRSSRCHCFGPARKAVFAFDPVNFHVCGKSKLCFTPIRADKARAPSCRMARDALKWRTRDSSDLRARSGNTLDASGHMQFTFDTTVRDLFACIFEMHRKIIYNVMQIKCGMEGETRALVL